MMSPQLVPLILLSPILLVTAYFDLKYMRIPDILSLGAIGLFVISIFLIGLPEAGMRLGAAFVVFVVGLGAFALRMVGGGDVKMLAVLMLFIPSGIWTLHALVFSASLAAGLVLISAWRALPFLHVHGWVSLASPRAFPMGISIALSGLALPIVIYQLV